MEPKLSSTCVVTFQAPTLEHHGHGQQLVAVSGKRVLSTAKNRCCYGLIEPSLVPFRQGWQTQEACQSTGRDNGRSRKRTYGSGIPIDDEKDTVMVVSDRACSTARNPLFVSQSRIVSQLYCSDSRSSGAQYVGREPASSSISTQHHRLSKFIDNESVTPTARVRLRANYSRRRRRPPLPRPAFSALRAPRAPPAPRRQT
ncbi:hypothetical protein EVAR_4392_1 [Eumeta japonica]|uniref:C1q domain-containing protein n=1 Tax=Eumeta variegata TaxID=151549 RepID=A0A4C1T082_EUMVA|nr:hypothetical protein EVAR_4392_1 [Eumeta japonica]